MDAIPTDTPDTPRSSKSHAFLWCLQVLLAIVFGVSGIAKLAIPYSELPGKAGGLSEPLVKFLGVVEVSGALGMILPALTRIKPILTPIAAVGLLVVMILATLFHVSRGEIGSLSVTVPLGLIAAYVAWGRFKKAPIRPRV